MNEVNLAIGNLDVQRVEAGSGAGALDAQAGFWVIHCAVVLADEQAAVAGEKLAVAVVESQRLVAAEVFVGDDLSLVVGHEGVHPDAVTLEGELLGPPLGQGRSSSLASFSRISPWTRPLPRRPR